MILDDRVSRWFLDDTGLSAGNHVIMSCLVGSLQHGTQLSKADDECTDDVDVMGVYVPAAEDIIGLGTAEHWIRAEEELDIVFYTARKWIKLLLNANPNVLCTLWVPEQSLLTASTSYDLVRGNREAFVSKRIYHSFMGYAHNQLKKMVRGESPRGYMGAKRKELVARYGYDVKNAAHTVRLFRMGCEFLETGDLVVDRTGVDAEQLKAIKRGRWSLDKVRLLAEHLEQRMVRAMARSSLPDKPDRRLAEQMLMTIYRTALCR